MLCSDRNEKEKERSESDDDEGRAYPRGKPPNPVTPRMLIKALKRLKKKSLRGFLFNPKDVTFEILRTQPNVEQDPTLLFLEVSDKLTCAAAAGLVGVMQNMGYFAFDMGQTEGRTDSRSELMFWIFYKKILKKKAEERKYVKELENQYVPENQSGEREKGKKVVRLMSFTGDHLHLLPLMHYRRHLSHNV